MVYYQLPLPVAGGTTGQSSKEHHLRVHLALIILPIVQQSISHYQLTIRFNRDEMHPPAILELLPRSVPKSYSGNPAALIVLRLPDRGNSRTSALSASCRYSGRTPTSENGSLLPAYSIPSLKLSADTQLNTSGMTSGRTPSLFGPHFQT